MLSISANGYGKRTPLLTLNGEGEMTSDKSFKVQKRGGMGIVAIQTSERNGELVRLRLVDPDDGLMVITDGGQVIRTRISEIRETGRNTQGVIIIRLSKGEQVVDIEPVPREEEEEDVGEEGEGVEGAEVTGDAPASPEGAEGTATDEPASPDTPPATDSEE